MQNMKRIIAALALTAAVSVGACAAESVPAEDPPLEVDHLFVMVGKEDSGRFAIGDEIREAVRIFPHLTWHEGQGTGGLYVYFENFYIEFLALEVPETAAANAARAGTDFNQRNDWRGHQGVSPFGIGLRDYQSDPSTLPFETFDYSAEWMGGHFTLVVAENADNLNEPWTFTMPIAISGPPGPDMRRDGFEEYLMHPAEMQNMTSLEITLTGDAPLSPTLQELVDEGLITVNHGEEPLAVVTFDDGAQQATIDMRPEVPLVLCY